MLHCILHFKSHRRGAACSQTWLSLRQWPPDPSGAWRPVRVASAAASASASWPWAPSCPMDPRGPQAAVSSPALQCAGLGCRPPLSRHRFGLAGVRLGVHRGRRGPLPAWLGRRAGCPCEHWRSRVTLIPALLPSGSGPSWPG
jgi:hypothetical protein